MQAPRNSLVYFTEKKKQSSTSNYPDEMIESNNISETLRNANDGRKQQHSAETSVICENKVEVEVEGAEEGDEKEVVEVTAEEECAVDATYCASINLGTLPVA